MVDVATPPLIAQQGNIRTTPFAQPFSDPSLTSLPPSMARTVGVANAPSVPGQLNPDTNGDGQLEPEEIAHLQAAASKGDKDAFDLLKALKLPTEIGLGVGAAALAGRKIVPPLVDAVARRAGLNVMPTHGPGGATMDPSRDGPKLSLPSNAPKQITDTTGSRFNQPAPSSEVLAIPDLRSPYDKLGGKLPTGAAAGDALRAAAKAARRVH